MNVYSYIVYRMIHRALSLVVGIVPTRQDKPATTEEGSYPC